MIINFIDFFLSFIELIFDKIIVFNIFLFENELTRINARSRE